MRARISDARRHLPASRILGLFTLSVAMTWLLVCLRTIDYLVTQGIDPEQIGYLRIALQVFDATMLFFSLLVFVAAGILPAIIMLVAASPKRSNVAQWIWALSIVGLNFAATAASA